MHNLFPIKVKLEPVSHKYYDNQGREFMSFSKVYELLAKKFDADFIAGRVAESKSDMSKEDVLRKWDGQRDEGNRVDEALELYAKTGQILKENEDIAELIKSVISQYSKYNRCYEQIVVYNENTLSAGSLDKLFIFSNRKDSAFGISDFKAFDDIVDEKGNVTTTSEETLFIHRGWLNYPFEHLPNTKYTKICFQLSNYAWKFESLTGRKCKSLFIHLINIKQKTHKKIPVPYLKSDIELLYNTHGSKIKELLDAKSTEEAF